MAGEAATLKAPNRGKAAEAVWKITIIKLS